MRRGQLVTLQILCPHFERPVRAQRNETTERLVDCESRRECVVESTGERGVTVAVYPQGCPVFRTRG